MPPAVSRRAYALIVLPFLVFAGCLQASGGKTQIKEDHAPRSLLDKASKTQRGNCQLTELKRKMLDLVNETRGQARQCGKDKFSAAAQLSWNCKLETAARAHSSDMARNNYFSHTDPEGARVGERVNAEGYAWKAVGENIAAGQTSAASVINSWLASPGHCANIMNARFAEMGMAKVSEPGSTYSPYWTQVFAQPR